jgi:hypothetical protein
MEILDTLFRIKINKDKLIFIVLFIKSYIIFKPLFERQSV